MGQIVLALVNRGSANPHDTVKDTIEIARMLQPAQPAFDLEAVVERVAARMGGRVLVAAIDPFANYERVEQFMQRFIPQPAPAGPAAEASAPAVASGWCPVE